MVFWLSELQGNVRQKVGDRDHMQCSFILSPLPRPCPSPLVSPYGAARIQDLPPDNLAKSYAPAQSSSSAAGCQFPLYSKVNARMNPWKTHSTHIQKPSHTQSKDADSSPFPQISMLESTESAWAPFPAWGWEGIVRFKAR